MLVEVYNNETIEDNKMEAFNTHTFINERIAIINEELTEAERDVEDYKRSRDDRPAGGPAAEHADGKSI